MVLCIGKKEGGHFPFQHAGLRCFGRIHWLALWVAHNSGLGLATDGLCGDGHSERLTGQQYLAITANERERETEVVCGATKEGTSY